MEKTLIYILLLLSYSTSGQDYKIDFGFKNDIKHHFTVEESRFTTGDSERKKDYSFLKNIDATFTELDTGLKCVWRYGNEKMVYKNKIKGNTRLNLYKGIEVEVLFNPQQGGLKLLNYTKVKESIRNTLLKTYSDQLKNMRSSTMQIIDNEIIANCSTPEDILSNYFPEINLYFELYSQSFKYGVELIKKDSIQNPFKHGGESFPIHIKTNVDNSMENTIVVKKVESTNKEEIDSIIYEMGKSMIKPGGSPLKKERLPKFSYKIITNYYYNRDLKLISRINYNKEVDVNGITKYNNLEIRLVEH